jgi:bifunctional non-homologous end joining protein LigD
MRKTNLHRLLARRIDGIHLAPFEQVEIGPDLFRHAYLMVGLEGLVSKHRESAYRTGRFDRWIKAKNRRHPAFSRRSSKLIHHPWGAPTMSVRKNR